MILKVLYLLYVKQMLFYDVFKFKHNSLPPVSITMFVIDVFEMLDIYLIVVQKSHCVKLNVTRLSKKDISFFFSNSMLKVLVF